MKYQPMTVVMLQTWVSQITQIKILVISVANKIVGEVEAIRVSASTIILMFRPSSLSSLTFILRSSRRRITLSSQINSSTTITITINHQWIPRVKTVDTVTTRMLNTIQTRISSSVGVEMAGVGELVAHIEEAAVANTRMESRQLAYLLSLSTHNLMKLPNGVVKVVDGELVGEAATTTSMERVGMRAVASLLVVPVAVITISTSRGNSTKNSIGQVSITGTTLNIVAVKVLILSREGVVGVILISEVEITNTQVGKISNSNSIRALEVVDKAIEEGLEAVESRMNQVVVVAIMVVTDKEEEAQMQLNKTINDQVATQVNRARSKRIKRVVAILLKNFMSFA